jgi:hypothetical protein
MSITNPADCEVRSVIRFLNAKNTHPAEIHRQLVEVYGEGVMNEGNVRKWCCLDNGGRTDVHSEARSGRPSLITEDLEDTGLMLTFVKIGDSPLMSFMKFSPMFRDLSSMKLSQFNSDTEKFVPDG